AFVVGRVERFLVGRRETGECLAPCVPSERGARPWHRRTHSTQSGPACRCATGEHSYVRREMSDLLECSLHRNVRVEARDMRSPAFPTGAQQSETMQKPLHILRTAAS